MIYGPTGVFGSSIRKSEPYTCVCSEIRLFREKERERDFYENRLLERQKMLADPSFISLIYCIFKRGRNTPLK